MEHSINASYDISNVSTAINVAKQCFGAESRHLGDRNESWEDEFSENGDRQTFCVLAGAGKTWKKIETIISDAAPLVKSEEQGVFTSAIQGQLGLQFPMIHSNIYLQSSVFYPSSLSVFQFCRCTDKQIQSLIQLSQGLPIAVIPATVSSPRDLPSAIRLTWRE